MLSTQTIPLFRIFDQHKALEFYIDWLGFRVDWSHGHPDMPLYMQVSLGNLILHLTEHHGDCCPGAKAFVNCTGLKAYHQQLLDKQYKYNRPGIELAPWNAYTVTVIDPFGNKLLFSETIS
ncbi:MAG: glyoxalase superfamily protein [Siphonobacter sp.]